MFNIDRNWYQFSAHWIYILLSLGLYQSLFPFYNFIGVYVFATIVYFLGQKYFSEIKNHNLLSVVTVCNSVYLNLGYNYKQYYILHIVVLLALWSKFFLRDKVSGKSLYNPSMVGIFIVAMLAPSYATHTPYLWSSEWWQIIIAFIAGSTVTYLVKTHTVSYSYMLSYMGFAFLIDIMKFMITGVAFDFQQTLFWVLGAFSFNKLIHTFHVISDPQSSPSSKQGRILFGVSIAFVEIIFKNLDVLNNVIISYLLVATVFQLARTRNFNPFKFSNTAVKA